MMKYDFNKYNKIPNIIWLQVKKIPEKKTNWYKQSGVWKSLNRSEYGTFSKEIGNALMASGIYKGDKISILSETRPEWVMCDMGIISSGCVTAPIYQSNTEEQVFYIADQSDSVLAFVEDQEQLDKMLAIWDRLPNIKKMIGTFC